MSTTKTTRDLQAKTTSKNFEFYATVMENDAWNSIHLVVPEFSSYKVSRKAFATEKLKNHLLEAIKYLGDQSTFEYEVKQISQFIYLGKNQFRMMKGFQEMKKTHQAAKKLKRLDIVDNLETFNSFVSDNFQSEILLPHRQHLDYMLMRLQGFSKILIRIVTCSRKSARYFLGVIKNGSFYIKGSIFVSSLGKIWDLGRQMCKYAVTLYNDLATYRDKLQPLKNSEWIFKDCKLPEQLDEWLGDEYEFYVNNETYESKLLTKTVDIENFRKNVTQVTEIFERFHTDEDMTCDKPENTKNVDMNQLKTTNNEIEDFTPIARNDSKDTKLYSYEHRLSFIQSRETIKLFLKFEEKYRKQDIQKSITIKKIKKNAWKQMRNDFKNKLMLMQENSLIEYFHDNINHYLN